MTTLKALYEYHNESGSNICYLIKKYIFFHRLPEHTPTRFAFFFTYLARFLSNSVNIDAGRKCLLKGYTVVSMVSLINHTRV